jgi:aryl-alcohol dehydrogenase-like predicted oxidoreductase
MNERRLGKSGLMVTPIGLGLAALGRPGYINMKHADDLGQNYDEKNMEQHAHLVLDAAWQVGVRYFDAARSYGNAEAFLASWLATRKIRPEEVTVGSKWGYTYTADWQVDAPVHETKEHSLPVLRRQRRESDVNLGAYLGLYQIHSATLESGVLENRAVLSELARYRDNGLVIGLTLSGPRQAETLLNAMKISENGRPLFECVQATWNLLEQSAGEALQTAHESGIGVIIKEALANGRLTAKNDEPAFAEKRALLEDVAFEQKTTIDALALAAVLAQPWVDVVLSGAATREQLISNVAAAQIVWNQVTGIKLAGLVETPQEYWTKRATLKWN